jgi:hypothetical protein
MTEILIEAVKTVADGILYGIGLTLGLLAVAAVATGMKHLLGRTSRRSANNER